MLTCSPTFGARVTIGLIRPAERFLTLTSCSLPLAPVRLPTESMAERRSSTRRSAGRGTDVDKDTVVDSKAASLLLKAWPENFFRIRSVNMLKPAYNPRKRRQFGTLRLTRLKRR